MHLVMVQTSVLQSGYFLEQRIEDMGTSEDFPSRPSVVMRHPLRFIASGSASDCSTSEEGQL